MKKVSIRKGFMALVVLLTVFGSFLAVKAEIVRADVPVVTTDNFALDSLNSKFNSLSVKLALPSGCYADTQLLFNGAVIAEDPESISYAFIDAQLSKNKVYEIRIRPFVSQYNPQTRQTEKIYGAWTATRAFCTLSPKVSLASKNSKTVQFKIPKIAGVKSVQLFLSKNYKSGYKKVANIKPGKVKKISKFAGKTFPYYKTYYYRMIVKLTDGRTCEGYTSGNFYIRKVYR